MSVPFRIASFVAIAMAFPAVAQQTPTPLTAPGAPAPAVTPAPAPKPAPASANKPKPAPKPAATKPTAAKPAPKPATAAAASATAAPTIGSVLTTEQQRQEAAAAQVIEQRVAYRQTVQADLATREGLLKQYETNYQTNEAKMKATHLKLLNTAKAVQDARAAEAEAAAKLAAGEAPPEGEEGAAEAPAAPAVDPAQVATLSKALEQQSFDLMVQRRQMDSLRSDVTRLKELLARLSK
ncbi:hypothetical protein ACFSM5_07565 [Lacibacterium aquatile]|uniref:Uncharacterized protein n=1 Tax=Lacibacterium aquatile TaxID=1168082 RepID=A0ABW5DNY8_9PROT